MSSLHTRTLEVPPVELNRGNGRSQPERMEPAAFRLEKPDQLRQQFDRLVQSMGALLN